MTAPTMEKPQLSFLFVNYCAIPLTPGGFLTYSTLFSLWCNKGYRTNNNAAKPALFPALRRQGEASCFPKLEKVFRASAAIGQGRNITASAKVEQGYHWV